MKGTCTECGGMMGRHFNGCPETPGPPEPSPEELMEHAPDADVTPHFNRLAPDVAERLSVLAGEGAKVIHIIETIKRHGFDSRNPLVPDSPTNRELLEKEIGHFEQMFTEMLDHRDLDAVAINNAAREKRSTINRWLHHNEVKPSR